MEGEEIEIKRMSQEEFVGNARQIIAQLKLNNTKIQAEMSQLILVIDEEWIHLEHKITSNNQGSIKKIEDDYDKFLQLIQKYTQVKSDFQVNIKRIQSNLLNKQRSSRPKKIQNEHLLQFDKEAIIIDDDSQDQNSSNTKMQFKQIEYNLEQGKQALRFSETKNYLNSVPINVTQLGQTNGNQFQIQDIAILSDQKGDTISHERGKLTERQNGNTIQSSSQQQQQAQANGGSASKELNSGSELQNMDQQSLFTAKEVSKQISFETGQNKLGYLQKVPESGEQSLEQSKSAVPPLIIVKPINPENTPSKPSMTDVESFFQQDHLNVSLRNFSFLNQNRQQDQNITPQKTQNLVVSNSSKKNAKPKKYYFISGKTKLCYVPLNNTVDSSDDSVCSFCWQLGQESNLNKMGPLLILSEDPRILAHQLCIIPATQNDNGMTSFEGQEAISFMKKSEQQKCVYCQGLSATYRCAKVGKKTKKNLCDVYFHFVCFFKSQANPQYQPLKFSLYCGEIHGHKPIVQKPKQKVAQDYPDQIQKHQRLSENVSQSVQDNMVVQLLQEVPIRTNKQQPQLKIENIDPIHIDPIHVDRDIIKKEDTATTINHELQQNIQTQPNLLQVNQMQNDTTHISQNEVEIAQENSQQCQIPVTQNLLQSDQVDETPIQQTIVHQEQINQHNNVAQWIDHQPYINHQTELIITQNNIQQDQEEVVQDFIQQNQQESQHAIEQSNQIEIEPQIVQQIGQEITHDHIPAGVIEIVQDLIHQNERQREDNDNNNNSSNDFFEQYEQIKSTSNQENIQKRYCLEEIIIQSSPESSQIDLNKKYYNNFNMDTVNNFMELLNNQQ